MKKFLFWSVILLLCIPGFSHAQEKPAASKDLLPLSVRNTEVRTLNSKFVEGMEYKIYVSLPSDYKNSAEQYPVVYITDAWSVFALVTQIYQGLEGYQEVPKLILVGIGYDGDIEDYIYNRARDFTPTHIPQDELPRWLAGWTPVSGGAPNFLNFIEKELMPKIESEYRVDNQDRAICGMSYGGLFVTYALFSRPDLFERFFIVCPYLGWDNYKIFTLEKEFAEKIHQHNRNVFLSVGSLDSSDMISDWARLRSVLAKYKSLNLTSVIFNEETHVSVIPAAYTRAFRVLYQKR